MRTILNSEKAKERCNAAALGMFNASVEVTYYDRIEGNADVESKIYAAKELKRIGIDGNIDLQVTGRIKYGQAWVEMPANGGKALKIMSSKNPDRQIIGHEMTHIKQNISKKMEVKDNYIFWEGKKYMSIKYFNKITKNIKNPINYAKYMEFPWEKEAYKRSGQLKHIKRIT